MENNIKELTYAKLLPAINSNNAQQLMDEAKTLVVTPQTLQSSYQTYLKLWHFYKYLEGIKKDWDKPQKTIVAERKAGFEIIMKPIREILDNADPILMAFNEEIKYEEGLINANISKINEIVKRHSEFINETVTLIVSAPDNSELIRIQKLIGSEKSRTGFYGEYHPKIKEACNMLLKLIDDRKNLIKENGKQQKQYDKAVSVKDFVLATQIKETMEFSQKIIEENGMLIAEDAFKLISDIVPITEDLTTGTIKPRLRKWSFKVTNIIELQKENPEFVEIIPNKKAIMAFQKSKENELDENSDNVFGSLILYKKPFFVGISKKKGEGDADTEEDADA